MSRSGVKSPAWGVAVQRCLIANWLVLMAACVPYQVGKSDSGNDSQTRVSATTSASRSTACWLPATFVRSERERVSASATGVLRWTVDEGDRLEWDREIAIIEPEGGGERLRTARQYVLELKSSRLEAHAELDRLTAELELLDQMGRHVAERERRDVERAKTQAARKLKELEASERLAREGLDEARAESEGVVVGVSWPSLLVTQLVADGSYIRVGEPVAEVARDKRPALSFVVDHTTVTDLKEGTRVRGLLEGGIRVEAEVVENHAMPLVDGMRKVEAIVQEANRSFPDGALGMVEIPRCADYEILVSEYLVGDDTIDEDLPDGRDG